MKPNIAGHSFHLTTFVLLFSIISFQPYAFASDLLIEGNDFRKLNTLGDILEEIKRLLN